MDNFQKLYDYLKTHFEGTILLNEPLYKYTTLRLGGPAAIYAQADTLKDLKLLLNLCEQEGIDFFVIGRGANLLISDKGFKGLVIHLGRDFNMLKINSYEATITAGAAVSLARVVQEAYANSLEGLAFAAGIPATVGGAVASNAGAFGQSICERLNEIVVLDKEGLRHLRKPLQAGYRKGPLKGGEILVEAVFGLKKGEQMIIKAQMERYFKQRKGKQPINYPNAGSIFKNPSDKISAGELIEKCGLKSKIIGRAMISDVHANFIINKGGAKASEVYALLKLAQRAVKEKFGVNLKPEIKLIGDFNE